VDSGKSQNHRLQALINLAGWNGQSLAEAVNAVGREANLPLTYTRSSIGQWIAGMTPRRPVPHVVAEAFARRLGRPVTPAKAGFDESAAEIERSEEGPLRRLVLLAVAAGPGSADTSSFRVYSLTGSSAPMPTVAEEIGRVPPSDPLRRFMRVEREDVESARVMLRLFADADAAGGPGYVRLGLCLYLADTLAPSLYASPPRIRSELVPVAARLAYLCGVMFYNDELHGFAQQYLQIASCLSVEAGEAESQAMALRAMSTQAVSLGHHDHGLSLAEDALGVAAGVLPQTLSTLYGQRAVARAATGDSEGAIADLAAAQAALPAAADLDDTLWGSPAAALAYQRGLTLALVGDVPNAVTQMELSIRHRSSKERHARAVTLSRVAHLRLRHGHLEQAIATWHRFLDDYPAVNSGRTRAALALLLSSIRPHQGGRAAGTLLTRALSMQQRLTYLTPGPRVAPTVQRQDMDTRVRFTAPRTPRPVR
jgi:tetratricopeptide (TPR) repeat protein